MYYESRKTSPFIHNGLSTYQALSLHCAQIPGGAESFSESVNCPVVSDCFSSELFMTPWTVAHQPPLSMGFSKQAYWSRLPFSSPGDFPDPGIEPESPIAGRFFTVRATRGFKGRCSSLPFHLSSVHLGGVS